MRYTKSHQFCAVNIIIDQGNTAIKVAQFENDQLMNKVVFKRDDFKSIQLWLESNVQLTDRILVSSVTEDQLNLDKYHVIYLDTDTPLPLVNEYGSKKTLGKDRIANAVAAWAKNPHRNSLVIDLGTCIKYDLVSSKGAYLGGVISPGLHMRFNALNHFTDKLPKVDPQEILNPYGIDTNSSLVHGVQEGMKHEINGFIQRFKDEFGQLTIFMTGGDLKYFDKGFKNSIFADSNLTVVGLNEILKYNA
jgi:type III pantothenate kinase